MALAEEELQDRSMDGTPRRGLQRLRWRVSLALLVLLAVALAVTWFSRERIAGNVIEGMLRDYDLPAQYEIESIGPEQQVLRNVVIGDPLLPDLTIERVTVNLRYRFGTPTVGRIVLDRPRLFGSWRGGTLTFGALDKALFRDTGEPPALPDLDVALVDGRALLETDYGPVGIKAAGEGELDDGFRGTIAATAPALDRAGCAASGATLYGQVTSNAGKPHFKGPVRLARLDCSDRGIHLAKAAFDLDATGDADLAGFDGRAALSSGAIAAGGVRANGLNGKLRATWRNALLNTRYSLVARGVQHPQAKAAVLTADGALRLRGGGERIEVETELEGDGLRIGRGLESRIASLGASTTGTLLAPLLDRFAGALRRESRASRFDAQVSLRKTGDTLALVVPEAALRGGSGATLLALSRGQWSSENGAPGRIAGNFSTGGKGLPRIVGRMERAAGGEAVFRLRMADYTAGDAHIAVPELVVAQRSGGRFGFAGRAIVSGALPGGSARELVLPLDGNWDGSRLALWRNCTDFRFGRLEVASLVLERRELTLCPARGVPILAYGQQGLKLAAGASSLDLRGQLAGTPIAMRSGPVGLAYPGNLSARDVDVTLGPAQAANTFRISSVKATLGPQVAGTFDGADIRLYAVPLDLFDTSGTWRYSDGVFALVDARFRLEDRSADDRFHPVVARDARLTLDDNVIRADAILREPSSDRAITAVDILHDLSSGTGHADLAVNDLLFDEALQPDTLSPLALGVIANARGSVDGTGRIDWNSAGVTSSGRFSSESLDFAAAFGPVRGASGTIVFSDLLNLTTAPGQTLHVASLNPGIEVTDGEVEFVLHNGQLLSVGGGAWPFMGGTLTLRPVDLNLGVSEKRAYVFEIEGLDAATFLQNLDLANISATGTFDGELPIVFDEAGNGRIEGGMLVSRPPGGNVSYVGELTYEDLSPIANFAFDSLRSLDYRRMTIGMNGSLSGEIITEVRFEGVSQGAGTKKNFITRQIAGLPLEFRVNIRAAFAQLLTNLRSLYDPAYVRDPRELGLLSDDGTRLKRETTAPPPAIKPEDLIPEEPPVQTNESENKP